MTVGTAGAYQDTRCIMAGAVVTCGQHGKIPIRVLNLHTEAFAIRTVNCLGLFEPVVATVGHLDTGSPKYSKVHSDKLLETLIEETKAQVPELERSRIDSFLRSNAAAFMREYGVLGRCEKYLHDTETGDAVPIKQRPYRLPVYKRE